MATPWSTPSLPPRAPAPGPSPVCGAAVTATASGGGYAVTLTSGEDRQNVDFGNYRNASLSGVKFEDGNADGSKSGDSGPSVSFDVKIFRDNGSNAGQLDSGDTLVDTVATAAGTGAWSKSGVKPDSYVVCEVQKSG